MSDEESASEKPNALEALVDSLGVVIARIIVTFALGSLMTAPLFFVVILFGSVNFYLAAFICGYSFLFLSTFIFIMYYFRALGRKADELFDGLNGFRGFLVFLTFIPALPLLFSVYPALKIFNKTAEKTFLKNVEFDIILFFFQSYVAFCLTVYCVSSIPVMSERYLLSGQVSVPNAMLFGLDMILKGVLFDVFEHFGLTLSDVSQTQDLGGLFFSFILRVTSSALVISIVVELFRSTRKRLVGNG